MKRLVEALVVGIALAGVAGCGMAAPMPARAPAPPAAEVATAPPPPPPPVVAASPPGSFALNAPSAQAEPEERRSAALRASADLVTAARELEASTGSCTAACRALGSMDRATGRLCGLASTREDARVCEESKAKLVAARERVRSACGSCPGGPTVDPNAAAPSP